VLLPVGILLRDTMRLFRQNMIIQGGGFHDLWPEQTRLKNLGLIGRLSSQQVEDRLRWYSDFLGPT
jgi:hypothetical protein